MPIHGWEEGALRSFVADFVVPQRDKPKVFGGDTPWCRIEDFNGTYLFGSKSNLAVSEDTIRRMGLRVYPTNTVIVSCSADLGRCAIVGRPLVTNQTFIGLVPSDRVDSRFLYYYMSNLAPILNEMASGATIKYLSREKFQDLPVRFPPLGEQQRIVGILDDALAGIATAKTNAERNFQNARAIFESQLNWVCSPRGGAWVEKTLEEVADPTCTLSYGIVQPGDEYPNGLPVVRPTDLTARVIGLKGLKRIDPTLAKAYGRTALSGGELLLCVRGSTGTVSIASAELVGANVTRGIVPIRFDGTLLTPDFGFYLLSSSAIQNQIREKTYGAALMQINIRDLRNLTLLIPPVKEQQGIAARLDDLHAKTQRLAAIYEHKCAALHALKDSLLHQAFAGNL